MAYLPLKVRVKLALKGILPASLFAYVLQIWRMTFSRLSSANDMDIVSRYTKKFLATYGYTVIGGPFAGMSYVHQAAGSSYLIKLIGIYEEVLHPAVLNAIDRKYSTMIDIGCAEGYYLIGVGSKSKPTRLIGYDIDKQALALTRELYEKNQLTNPLLLLENCTPEDLEERIDGSTLLMCDAEGFEYEILDPSKTPSLANVETFIVELHDFVVPHVKETLISRFKETHDIAVLRFTNGNPKQYPFLMEIHERDRYTLLRERGEQDQEWLVMERK